MWPLYCLFYSCECPDAFACCRWGASNVPRCFAGFNLEGVFITCCHVAVTWPHEPPAAIKADKSLIYRKRGRHRVREEEPRERRERGRGMNSFIPILMFLGRFFLTVLCLGAAVWTGSSGAQWLLQTDTQTDGSRLCDCDPTVAGLFTVEGCWLLSAHMLQLCVPIRTENITSAPLLLTLVLNCARGPVALWPCGPVAPWPCGCGFPAASWRLSCTERVQVWSERVFSTASFACAFIIKAD